MMKGRECTESLINRMRLRIVFLSIALRDRLKPRHEIREKDEHLKAAIEWLKRAQDSTGNGGVSAGYFDHIGWDSSYPETTGYTIPTFFDYADFSHDTDSRKRAIEMSDFLLSIQMPDGAFRIGGPRAYPIGGAEVFDTGQILQGLTRCYRETKCDKYIESATRAGDWIIAAQEKDGSWSKQSYHGVPHTFYTRVALALLELFEVVGEPKLEESATKNVKWALTNCNENGWYQNCGAEPSSMSTPSTHFIAYAAEGILECGLKLKNREFIGAATRTMNALLTKLLADGYLKGTYDKNWESIDNYSCLTGDAQIALIWLKLFELSKNKVYYDGAIRLSNFLKSTQYLCHWNEGVKGGIKGSQPIYGDYNPNRYINWAAKFFVDLQLKIASLNLN
jgi:hypothetical protein